MFSPLGITILVVVALLTVLVLFIATRPAGFRIERSAVIKAPPAAVFSLINDFHQWVHWSPWEKLDATMQKTFTGPPAGAGASYSWHGNKQVGEGRMTLLKSEPDRSIHIKLEFLKPFVATNDTVFEFAPVDGGTRVVWGMEGKRDFMMKAFCLVMNMDKMVGKDFENGLANLDKAAQEQATAKG
ncbi:MAG: SRPBCC family protein [Planctomycetota bacterium]|nr:SRPBCC family protein [Planctomycetota bacterium]